MIFFFFFFLLNAEEKEIFNKLLKLSRGSLPDPGKSTGQESPHSRSEVDIELSERGEPQCTVQGIAEQPSYQE